MKIATIGDLHGRDVWKQLNPDDCDLMVFLGDYVDSFDKSNVEIKHNLESLISLKKQHPDKVVLLLGNHEQNYWTHNINNRCSGYRPEAAIDLHQLFRDNHDLFQVAYQKDNYLWTHAGVHRGWYEYEFPYNSDSVADDLNAAFLQGEQSLFNIGYLRGGWKAVGGPFWVDAKNMYKKPLDGYHQIVGHTPMKKINTITKNDNTSVTFCDCLETVVDFHIINL